MCRGRPALDQGLGGSSRERRPCDLVCTTSGQAGMKKYLVLNFFISLVTEVGYYKLCRYMTCFRGHTSVT